MRTQSEGDLILSDKMDWPMREEEVHCTLVVIPIIPARRKEKQTV